MPEQNVGKNTPSEPTVADFYDALVSDIDEERERAHAEHGGPTWRCLDVGHSFLCRFPAGSCIGGMCNE